MRQSIQIARIGGIDLRIDQSWLFVFFLVAWSLASTFAQWHPAWGLGVTLATALAAAVLFFVSVVAHELAHSFAALGYGLPIRNITLHMFGGVSNVEREPPTPTADLVISVVGPLTSIGLGVAMTFGGWLLAGYPLDDVLSPVDAARNLGPLSTLLLWLGPVNVTLGLFNLLPGLPLDGGRLLRAVLWKLGGDRRTATQVASLSGQTIGWLLIIAGVFAVMGMPVPLFGNGLGGGLWAILLGWFLRTAAASTFTSSLIEELLDGVAVHDLMRRNGPWFDASSRLTEVTDRLLWWGEEQGYPVFDRGAFVGVLAADDVRRLHPSEWELRTVRDTMTPVTALARSRPHDRVVDALRTLQRAGVRQLPVIRADGVLAGMLYEHDIMRWLEVRAADGDAPWTAQPSLHRA